LKEEQDAQVLLYCFLLFISPFNWFYKIVNWYYIDIDFNKLDFVGWEGITRWCYHIAYSSCQQSTISRFVLYASRIDFYFG
jgi:hypothetical protein